MPTKFEVRSFECVGSGQRSSITIQNRWIQVRGPEIDRRQSLIFKKSMTRVYVRVHSMCTQDKHNDKVLQTACYAILLLSLNI